MAGEVRLLPQARVDLDEPAAWYAFAGKGLAANFCTKWIGAKPWSWLSLFDLLIVTTTVAAITAFAVGIGRSLLLVEAA